MLLGWLLGGWLLAGGKIKSEVKRAKAIENNKETYVDACGKKDMLIVIYYTIKHMKN